MINGVRLLTGDPAARRALASVRVVYTDLDGTFVAPGGSFLADAEGAPSLVLAERIVALAQAGLEVVPVSGRSRPQLHEFTRLLGFSAFIAEAGGVIVHGTGPGAKVRVDHGLWPDDALAEGETPFEAISRAGAAERLLEAFPGRIEHYATWRMDREVSLPLRGCLNTAEGQAVLDALPLPLDLVDNGVLRDHGALTCRDMPPHAYHVVPRGVSKSRAISLDLAWRGLGPDSAAAIGDSATDLEMAGAVGMMVLVANALESAGVTRALGAAPRTNVWRTAGRRTEGWAEFARTWLEAARRV